MLGRVADDFDCDDIGADGCPDRLVGERNRIGAKRLGDDGGLDNKVREVAGGSRRDPHGGGPVGYQPILGLGGRAGDVPAGLPDFDVFDALMLQAEYVAVGGEGLMQVGDDRGNHHPRCALERDQQRCYM